MSFYGCNKTVLSQNCTGKHRMYAGTLKRSVISDSVRSAAVAVCLVIFEVEKKPSQPRTKRLLFLETYASRMSEKFTVRPCTRQDYVSHLFSQRRTQVGKGTIGK